jgi:hypothetical protein
MKRVYLYIIISILSTSCDPDIFHNYSIKNNCNEEIIVNIIDYKNIETTVQVGANSEQCIYQGITFSTVYMEYFFKKVAVAKNDTISKKNYINHDLWIITRATRTYQESLLIINPNDFE